MKETRKLKVNGIVIFDKRNPNFNVIDTEDEISNLFKKFPVPVLVDDKIVGFVKDIEFWSDDRLIGDLIVWDMINFNIELKNYQVQLNNDGKITEIMCIEYDA